MRDSSFTANLTGNADRKVVDGKTYLVAPVSMIVPGVLAGSRGPLHYPQDMVARNAGRWENVPLTLGHPSDPLTNTPLSASDHGVKERLGLGFVKNDRFANGKHRAEAWFDEDALRRKAPHVLQALNSGRRIEVSTGLYTDEEEQPGTWNGRQYTHVVRGYKPDHLAILTDQRGACSVSDGCGVHNAATANAAPDLIARLLHAATSAHILHFQTKSFAQHEALGELYSSLPGLVDDLVEAWQGKHGVLKSYPSGYSPPAEAPAAFVKSLSASLKAERSSLGDDSEIQNAVDEIASLLDSTMYKLQTLNSCGGGMADDDEEPVDNDQPMTPPPPPPSSPAGESKGGPPAPPVTSPPAVNDSECPCGGECESCKAKKTQNVEGCEIETPVDDEYTKQPRCPVKQTFQPKGFRGKGRGEVHVATKKGFNDNPVEELVDRQVDETTVPGDNVQNSNPEGCNQYKECGSGGGSKDDNDRDILSKTDSMTKSSSLSTAAAGRASRRAVTSGKRSDHVEAANAHARLAEKHEKAGRSDQAKTHRSLADTHRRQAVHNLGVSPPLTNEGEEMDRKQMIQHLTTNCSCYKGKLGLAVLNAMSDEMLSEHIVNAQIVQEARKLVPAGITTNAMPAALKAAADKKAMPAAPAAAPEEEEDDEDDAPAPVANRSTPKTTDEWLKTAPPAVRNLVRNALANERRQKDELIEVLTANVSEDAKGLLVNHYLKLPVEALKAQVAALPAAGQALNGEYDFGEPTSNYDAAALSGFDRTVTNQRGAGEVIIEEPAYIGGRN